MDRPRLYSQLIAEHLENYRQMLFLAGPRQVGKTTLTENELLGESVVSYFNWDIQKDKNLILLGQEAIIQDLGLEKIHENPPIVVFDELHKYPDWKNFLKGIFDKYQDELKIIVTGSSALDVYRKGQDSLMGRYFAYNIHPLSVAELVRPTLPTEKLVHAPQKLDAEQFEALINFGGFPEPFLKSTTAFFNRWQRLRTDQLFREDIRDLTKVQELTQLELYAHLMKDQVGSLVSFDQFAKKLGVSNPSIKNWLAILENFYYCFSIRPWSTNINRSLLKEPKIYLRDWSLVKDRGARLENMVACHLLKSIQCWQDLGYGDFGLHFVRDKQKQEVDFLVSKNNEPWFLVEVKASANQSIPKSLYAFQKALNCPHAFMVVFDQQYIDKDVFTFHEPKIVPAQTFLSQLV